MGIPTYTTEKPSNSETLPDPHPRSESPSVDIPRSSTNTSTSPLIATPATPLRSPSHSGSLSTSTSTAGPSRGPPEGRAAIHSESGSSVGMIDADVGISDEAASLYAERMEEEYAKREGGA